MYAFIENKIVYLHSITTHLNHDAKEHKIMKKLEKYPFPSPMQQE
jgi:hypothetical protein